jgi:hypothetical protein
MRTIAQFFCSTWQLSFLLPGRERVKVILRCSHQAGRTQVDHRYTPTGVALGAA